LKTITILGSTGSVGVNTIDVVKRHPNQFRIFALTANTNVALMEKQIHDCQPRYAVLRNQQAADVLRQKLKGSGSKTEILSGSADLASVAGHDDVDYVMAAIVGAAGLVPTLAAVKAGKRVLLANKEVLVMSGALFMDAVTESGAELLPIDSEHNAIFQCLPVDYKVGLEKKGVRKLLLTASGGPFRDLPLDELKNVTPEQACAHPNWEMGQKISVDSATMMNKGLELIEACWLFDTRAEQIEIVIHRQSIIHSMVEYSDGSILAQMGNPDMRTPIAFGLGWPDRIDSAVAPLDLAAIGRLDFEAIDLVRYPAVRLAAESIAEGGTMTTALNAANEEAVTAFLQGKLGFMSIANVVDRVLQGYQKVPADSVDIILSEDQRVRALAKHVIASC
jgi:1-deoxy-D-xylulose-5-phosphate reductoisomerase